MEVNSDDWRHIPKKPRLGLDRPAYNWKHISIALTVAAILMGAIAFVLPG